MVSCGKGQGGQARGAVSGPLGSAPLAAAESKLIPIPNSYPSLSLIPIPRPMDRPLAGSWLTLVQTPENRLESALREAPGEELWAMEPGHEPSTVLSATPSRAGAPRRSYRPTIQSP